jgi:chaperone modulatory protein CbpM
MTDLMDLVDARPLGEDEWITVDELCRVCRIDVAVVTELVEVGLVSPRGGPGPEDWLVPAAELPRLRIAGSLIRDLGVNATGAAMVVELLEAQRELERRLRELEKLVSG